MKRAPPNIIECLDDPKLGFGSRVTSSESWRPWRVALKAVFGLEMTEDEAAIFRECTGRAEPPAEQASEGWFICGRRAGKSYALALTGVYLGCFRDYRPYLSPGERAHVMVLASDRRQSRLILRYVKGALERSKLLSALVEREVADGFDLANSVSLEIATASNKTTRGYALAAVLADEVAFWPVEGTGAVSDEDILAALRPALSTFPNALLLAASSPYAKRGALYSAFKHHYGSEDPRTLVWRAPTRRMNPSIPQAYIDREMERDPASASSEYLAEWREGIGSFISREVVELLVMRGRREISPIPGVKFYGFVDPSGGGGSDSFTLAIAYASGDTIVLAAVREITPPFSPADAVAELSAFARSYGLSEIVGDRFGGAWPQEAFQAHGITYRYSDLPRSGLYLELLPILNSGKIELLDNPRLVSQLSNLDRRTVRGSRDVIDHPPNSHDDIGNCVAGVVSTIPRKPAGLVTGSYGLGIGGRAEVLRGSDWRNGLPPPPGPWRAPIPPPTPRLYAIGSPQPADPFPRSKSGGVLRGTF